MQLVGVWDVDLSDFCSELERDLGDTISVVRPTIWNSSSDHVHLVTHRLTTETYTSPRD